MYALEIIHCYIKIVPKDILINVKKNPELIIATDSAINNVVINSTLYTNYQESSSS